MPGQYAPAHKRSSRFGHLVHGEEQNRKKECAGPGKDRSTITRQVVEQTTGGQSHNESGSNLHAIRPTITPHYMELPYYVRAEMTSMGYVLYLVVHAKTCWKNEI